MKRFIALLLLTLPLFFTTACTEEDSDAIDELVGSYVGAMNVDTPSFTNAQFTVAVSKVSGTSVRISPSGAAGTEWTASLTNLVGVYTCISCVTSDQITFTKVSGNYQLTYNHANNNEQFVGLKQ